MYNLLKYEGINRGHAESIMIADYYNMRNKDIYATQDAPVPNKDLHKTFSENLQKVLDIAFPVVEEDDGLDVESVDSDDSDDDDEYTSKPNKTPVNKPPPLQESNSKLNKINQYIELQKSQLQKEELNLTNTQTEIDTHIKNKYYDLLPEIKQYSEGTPTPTGYVIKYCSGVQTDIQGNRANVPCGFIDKRTEEVDRKKTNLVSEKISPINAKIDKIGFNITLAKIVKLLIEEKYNEANKLLYSRSTIPSGIAVGNNYNLNNSLNSITKPIYINFQVSNSESRLKYFTMYELFETYFSLDYNSKNDRYTPSEKDEITKLRSVVMSAVIDNIMTQMLEIRR